FFGSLSSWRVGFFLFLLAHFLNALAIPYFSPLF
ncbi:MAG: hypothetical protein ACI9B8_001783, partial [Sulfitobacter sp.]